MIALLDDRAEKLIRLGLNAAATDGETSNAGAMFFRHLRNRGVTAEALLSRRTNTRPSPPPREEWLFPFGKHKGKPLDEIGTDYLEWVLGNLAKLAPAVRRRIEQELARR